MITEELLSQRITDYLNAGGLFNPELANHDEVRDLLIECKAAFDIMTKFATSRKLKLPDFN